MEDEKVEWINIHSVSIPKEDFEDIIETCVNSAGDKGALSYIDVPAFIDVYKVELEAWESRKCESIEASILQCVASNPGITSRNLYELVNPNVGHPLYGKVHKKLIRDDGEIKIVKGPHNRKLHYLKDAHVR